MICWHPLKAFLLARRCNLGTYRRASLAAKAQAAMTNRILKTAEPTMVPIPTSFLAMKTPMTEVKSSGAEPPAAIKVAPATSGLTPSWNTKWNFEFSRHFGVNATLTLCKQVILERGKLAHLPNNRLPCQLLSLFNQSIFQNSRWVNTFTFPKKSHLSLFFCQASTAVLHTTGRKESILDTSQQQHSFTAT